MKRFCTRCGNELSGASIFCDSCGAPTGNVTVGEATGPRRTGHGRWFLIAGAITFAIAIAIGGLWWALFRVPQLSEADVKSGFNEQASDLESIRYWPCVPNGTMRLVSSAKYRHLLVPQDWAEFGQLLVRHAVAEGPVQAITFNSFDGNRRVGYEFRLTEKGNKLLRDIHLCYAEGVAFDGIVEIHKSATIENRPVAMATIRWAPRGLQPWADDPVARLIIGENRHRVVFFEVVDGRWRLVRDGNRMSAIRSAVGGQRPEGGKRKEAAAKSSSKTAARGDSLGSVAQPERTSSPRIVGKWNFEVGGNKLGVWEFFSDKTWTQNGSNRHGEGTYSVLDDGRVKITDIMYLNQTTYIGHMDGGDLILESQFRELQGVIKLKRK